MVFKLTSEGPRYLLVEASGTRGRWVFPKGHVEDGETASIAALREVSEEAGVRGRLIRRLRPVEQKKEGERISIVYFLMAYAGRTKPLDKRRIRWLTFDEAIEALDLGKSRRVLRSADRLISAATGEEPRRYRLRRAAAHFAEWLVLGALALLFMAPIPPLAALLAPLAGMLVSLAMRALLRPLEGLVLSDDDVTLPGGDDQLRLLIGGAEWIARTDYLGGPIRIAGALAVLLPGVPASGGSWVAPAGLALAALLSWVLGRKLRASALWLAVLLAAHSIATAGNTIALVTAFALSAVSAAAWWRLERRRASVLAAVGGSR
ncbi:MAG TPA: NUDIX domain-containing protein, partial [Burkholderiales bacterium]|nr:NUDIX domain-containing protein [Burkholderiales bacterium]